MDRKYEQNEMYYFEPITGNLKANSETETVSIDLTQWDVMKTYIKDGKYNIELRAKKRR